MKQIVTPESALDRLEMLCARSEHCTFELRRKLKTWNVASDDAEAIISSLRERRFVDDRRFTKAFIRDKYHFNRWGRMKLKIELLRKGISADIIAEGFEEIDPEEYFQVLTDFLKAKEPQVAHLKDIEKRYRLLRMAVGRGFEGELVKKALDNLAND